VNVPAVGGKHKRTFEPVTEIRQLACSRGYQARLDPIPIRWLPQRGVFKLIVQPHYCPNQEFRFDAQFDEIVSVEETGSFKPARKVHEFVAKRMNRPVGELRLFATHDWDTHGAMTAGMQAAYIDRSGIPYHPLYRQPDVCASFLDALVELILVSDGRK
jgi:hypothetical protein